MEWKEFYIPKRSGGKRLITAPDKQLKEKQSAILSKLYEIYYPFSEFHYAFGGLLFKSIKQSAEKHIGKQVVIRLDIENFFDNIDKETLIRILEEDFKKKDVKNPEILLRKIEKYCFYNDRIPQGAITSPFLSNIYLIVFDKTISSIAKLGYYNYSRYFDDLTFSFNSKKMMMEKLDDDKNIAKQPLEIGEIIGTVKENLNKLKLKLNYEKIKIMTRNKRQSVCNVTVNEKININKKYYKLLRAIKHHFDNDRETTITKEQYLGHLAFVHSISPEIVEKLSCK